MTTTINTPYASATYATSGHIWFGSLTVGPGAGYSVNHYTTNTTIDK